MTENRLNRIEDKLDHAIELLGGMPDLQRRVAVVEASIAPIQSHVAAVHGALKFLAILVSLVGVMAGLAKAIS